MMDRYSLFAFVVIVGLIAGCHFLAPCSAFGWMAVKDVPVRCLAEYAR